MVGASSGGSAYLFFFPDKTGQVRNYLLFFKQMPGFFRRFLHTRFFQFGNRRLGIQIFQVLMGIHTFHPFPEQTDLFPFFLLSFQRFLFKTLQSLLQRFLPLLLFHMILQQIRRRKHFHLLAADSPGGKKPVQVRGCLAACQEAQTVVCRVPLHSPLFQDPVHLFPILAAAGKDQFFLGPGHGHI